jgi:hypothetical protein
MRYVKGSDPGVRRRVTRSLRPCDAQPCTHAPCASHGRVGRVPATTVRRDQRERHRCPREPLSQPVCPARQQRRGRTHGLGVSLLGARGGGWERWHRPQPAHAAWGSRLEREDGDGAGWAGAHVARGRRAEGADARRAGARARRPTTRRAQRRAPPRGCRGFLPLTLRIWPGTPAWRDLSAAVTHRGQPRGLASLHPRHR